MQTDEPDLVRYWFEFHFADGAVQPADGITLDGGTAAQRLLGLGAGVTGYDEADCLRMLNDALGEELPPLVVSTRAPTISVELARESGNVSWRGVWFPPLNRGGPTIL
jgi:hypothetical protein